MEFRLSSSVLLSAVGLIVAAVSLTAAADVPTGEGLLPPQLRKTAPSFVLDSNVGRIDLSRYKGRVVLLDFWATWCTGCKVEIPWYVEFQKKYGRRGLASIGVAMDLEGWPVVKPYLEAHPIGYPIVLGVPDLERSYDITNLPVTLLIDRRGRIADAHVGMVEKDSWEREILQLLREHKR